MFSGPIVRFHMMSWQFNICLQNNETVSILVYQENPVFQYICRTAGHMCGLLDWKKSLT